MNENSRQHGVIDPNSQRLVGMSPELANQVIRDVEDMRYPLLASSLCPPVVEISVGSEPIGTLDNGLGANWPPAYQGEEAFPAEDDAAGWEHIFHMMNGAGIRWVRYWLQLDDLMVDGRIDGAHRYLTRLDRLQQWAAESGSTIMLDFCYIPPAWRHDDIHDVPADIDAYVNDLLVPVLVHLVRERRCTAIRQLCLYNEPFNADVTPYLFFPATERDPLQYYVHLHERLRAGMDAAGLREIGLIGPNTANLFQRHIEMLEDQGLTERVRKAFGELDAHMWRMRYDYHPPSKRWPGYTLSEGIERYLRPTLSAAKRMGMRLSLTEAGAMYFNESPATERVTQHDAVLLMIEQLVRAINEGISGAMVWSFLSAGKTDGQWGWLGSRRQGFAPVPHLYHGFSTLMRYHRPGSAILPCTSRRADFSSFISAAALALPDGGHTVWIVNDHPVEKIQVRLSLPPERQRRPLNLHRKGFAPEPESLDTVQDGDHLSLVVPGMSLTVLTTL